jgi:hypothetical protein
MIISSLLNREKLKIDDPITVLWTKANKSFEEFIQKLNCNIVDIHQVYYGNNSPNIIICNDKIEYYQYCYQLSTRLHLPVLLIDHIERNPIYDLEKVKSLNYFPCYHHVCISKKIEDSWQLKNTQILSYNINEKDNLSIWYNLIFQTTQQIFKG